MSQAMRRFDRAITHEEAVDLLDKGLYGVLSTVDTDGRPYSIPMCYVWDGDGIVLHGAATGSKCDAFASCGVASFCVVGRTRVLPESFAIDYESTVVTGSVVEIPEDEKADGLMKFIQKYSQGHETAGSAYVCRAIDAVRLYKIVPDAVSGKARRSAS